MPALPERYVYNPETGNYQDDSINVHFDNKKRAFINYKTGQYYDPATQKFFGPLSSDFKYDFKLKKYADSASRVIYDSEKDKFACQNFTFFGTVPTSQSDPDVTSRQAIASPMSRV